MVGLFHLISSTFFLKGIKKRDAIRCQTEKYKKIVEEIQYPKPTMFFLNEREKIQMEEELMDIVIKQNPSLTVFS